MSAHPPAQSSSQPAPEPDAQRAHSNGAITPPAGDTPRPSTPSTPSSLSRQAALAGLVDLRAQSSPKNDASMLSALPAPSVVATEPLVADAPKDGFDEHGDNRSSSLSEIGDASDDHSEPTPRPTVAADIEENDSEAETERLEKTPRKFTRTVTNTSLASDHTYEHTPSKLAHSKTVGQDDSVPASPSANADDTAMGNTADEGSALHSLSLLAASEAASLEFAGKKRKRSEDENSFADEQSEQPARKRSGTSKSPALNGDGQGMVDNAEQADAEDELDMAGERISQLAQEEIDLEERQANIAVEAVSELATVAKHTKPRKGGRRGKRKIDDTGPTANEVLASTEAQDAEVEGDHEDDDSAAVGEEAAKKKNAIDELAKIEKKFKIFREKLCDEQIAQYEQELEMLKQPNCVHPEYMAMIKCIDDRRAEKIAYENKLLLYKQKNLEVITKAERHQAHSQYLQTVRDLRETILSECNQRIFELQRGRRQLGVEDVDYIMKLPEKRSDQIRHQAAYNLEVSVLSGVAKYVGFPAAPEIRPARPAEIDDDLRAMKISTRPPAPLPYVRPYNRTSTADEAAAEEQFLERTPWANPQHPVVQSHYGHAPGPSRVPSYQTPAGQRRVIDVNAPNGSASTIEMNSNPPSSNAGTGPHHANGRFGDSESPVLRMKRQPSDHPSYTETPPSHPRIAGSVRESYPGSQQPLSSPAAAHVETQAEEHGARWGGNGMRSLNPGASPLASGPSSLAGRPDPSRGPFTQRSGLGTVSVGSGNGLFGR